MSFNDTAWGNFRSVLITGFRKAFSIRVDRGKGLFGRERRRAGTGTQNYGRPAQNLIRVDQRVDYATLAACSECHRQHI